MTFPQTGALDRRMLTLARISVAAIFLVSGAGLGVWAAHIPLLKAGLGLDDAGLGFVLLAMGVGAVLAMPVTGLVLHRFGAAPTTIVAGALFSAAVALPPHAPDAAALMASAFMLGALIGGLDVAMNAHAAAIEKALGRPIMSSIHAFFSIGGLAGSAGAGGLIALGLSPAAGMGAGAAALLAITALAALRLAIPGGGAEEAHGLRLPKGAVLGLGALALLAFLAEGAMIDWSAVYMSQAVGAGPALAAYGYAAFSAAMTAARLTGDRVVGRLGPLRTVQASGVVAAAGLCLVVAAPAPWVALAGFAIAGLGFANVVPVLFSASTRLPGIAPGAALAMVATMAYGGGLMGPPLIGFLSNAYGLRVAFLLLVAAGLVIAVGVRRAAPRA
ncbi:MFS transporter [Methylopila turkensis]|uniref:MFS transporter n=1 Tax=Methylopila turkensis TaxID=1437816 RepID=A0A9W6JNC2_9HYPH|nr:MFS transporter [Methylopila turkensis]GLK80342.1 MFS transporter [Methylopila turkensis]